MNYSFIFRHRGFLKLWLAQMLSATAQHLINFALIIKVFDLAKASGNSNVSVGLLVLSYGIPSILFASVAGVYVDHWNKRTVMLVANALRAVLVLGFLFWAHSLVEIFALSFIIATATQFFTPAEAASIPLLVPKKNLLAANSLFVLSFYATFVIGYSSAAPIIKFAGNMAPFYLAATMFGTAALLSLLLPNLKPADAMRKHLKVILADTGIELKRNWQAITSQPKLYAPIMYLTLVQAVLGTILTLAPALALALLAAPLTDVSQFLIIPAGLGMVTGVVLIGFFNRWWSKEKLVRGSSLIMAISFLVLGLVGRFHIFSSLAGNQELVAVRWFVAALVLTLGLVNAVLSTSAQTILQENTSEDTRGKVFGALNMLLNIASTLPVLLAATLADRFGVTTVLIVLGGFLTVAVLALAAFSLRQTKALTRSSN